MSSWWWVALGVAVSGAAALTGVVAAAGREAERLRQATVEVRDLRAELARRRAGERHPGS